ncbi:hypothetical protein ACFRNT_11460 [Streptomyces sp. NPDC056697]|uniref:hypothetical protein n=1 Tax=Streptomyces sp. NPDC056697 TaxID=3345915 RepID=UPI0036B9B8FC
MDVELEHSCDDRRERYAAAIEEGAGPAARESDIYGAAHAAMVVADEEVSRAVGGRAALVAENARLREELDESERRYRSSVETYQEMSAEFSKLVRWREEDAKEIARLLAALAKAEDTAGKLTADLVRKEAANEGLARALAKNQMRVERVRAVLAELNRRADESSEAAQEVLSGTEYDWAAGLLGKALNAPATVANPNRTKVDE